MKKTKMTRVRKEAAQRKSGAQHTATADVDRKPGFVYSAAFQRWFERARVS